MLGDEVEGSRSYASISLLDVRTRERSEGRCKGGAGFVHNSMLGDFPAQDNSGLGVPGSQRNPAFVDFPSAPGSSVSVSPQPGCLLHKSVCPVSRV